MKKIYRLASIFLAVMVCSFLGTPQATAAYKVNTSMIDA